MRWPACVARTAPSSTAASAVTSEPVQQCRRSSAASSTASTTSRPGASGRSAAGSPRRRPSGRRAGRRSTPSTSPATPATNDAFVASASSTARDQPHPCPLDVDGEVGLAGAVPHVGGVWGAASPDLGEEPIGELHQRPGRRRSPERAGASLGQSVVPPHHPTAISIACRYQSAASSSCPSNKSMFPQRHRGPRARCQLDRRSFDLQGSADEFSGGVHVAGHPRGVRRCRPQRRSRPDSVIRVGRRSPAPPIASTSGRSRMIP